MKKLMKKKVNIFGKAIPVFAIFILGMALVSAALIPYFAQITGLVTVDQGLSVDGVSYNTPITYGVTMTSLEEKTVSSDNYELRNTANVEGIVRLDTICVNSTSDDCEVTSTAIFEISTTGGVENWDRVVTQDGSTLISAVTSLSFDYELTETTSGFSPYFVLGLDTNNDGLQDDWAVSMQDTGKVIDTEYTQDESSLSFHIVSHGTNGNCTQASPCNLAEVIDAVGLKTILYVKVAVGEWGDATTTTALVKNIEVNSVNVIENGIVVPAGSGSAVEGDVDFSIVTDFPKMMLPDTYTITTTVNPVA